MSASDYYNTYAVIAEVIKCLHQRAECCSSATIPAGRKKLHSYAEVLYFACEGAAHSNVEAGHDACSINIYTQLVPTALQVKGK